MLLAMLRLPALRHRERQLKLRALEALDRFQLADKANWPAGILVAGLNADETAAVGEQLRLLRSSGHTMLLVEHDMDLVMEIADQVIVLDSGRCIATGTPDEVRRNPLVLEAYLGRMEATA